jgi:capsid assembly protease
MPTDEDSTDAPPQARSDDAIADDQNTGATDDGQGSTAILPAAAQFQPAPAVAATAPTSAAAQPGTLAELSASLREAAAEIAEIAAQAGRLGIAIDAAKALREGTAPEALRRLVLERASAATDARDIVAAPPSPVLPKSEVSPIVAAARKAASAGARG